MVWGEPIIHADSGGIRDESNDMYWKRLSFKGIQRAVSYTHLDVYKRQAKHVLEDHDFH